jgi:hypothetical protein
VVVLVAVDTQLLEQTQQVAQELLVRDTAVQQVMVQLLSRAVAVALMRLVAQNHHQAGMSLLTFRVRLLQGRAVWD